MVARSVVRLSGHIRLTVPEAGESRSAPTDPGSAGALPGATCRLLHIEAVEVRDLDPGIHERVDERVGGVVAGVDLGQRA